MGDPSSNFHAPNPLHPDYYMFAQQRQKKLQQQLAAAAAAAEAFMRQARWSNPSPPAGPPAQQMSYSSGPQQGLSPADICNVQIRGISDDCTDEALRKMCTEFGRVLSARVAYEDIHRTQVAFGFVVFEAHQEALHAVTTLNARGFQVSFAKRPKRMESKGQQTKHDDQALYIANLSASITEDELRVLLSGFGQVLSCKLLRRSGTGRGVAIVHMGSTTECQEAISKLNGKTLYNSDGPLVVKFADPPKHDNISMKRLLEPRYDEGLEGKPVAPSAQTRKHGPLWVPNETLLKMSLDLKVSLASTVNSSTPPLSPHRP